MTDVSIALAIAAVFLLGAAIGAWRGRGAGRRAMEPRLHALEDGLEDLERERSACQRLLAATQQQLEAVMAAVEEGVLVIDGAERIVAANAQAALWFDLGPPSRTTLMGAVGSAELRDVVRETLRGEAPPGVPVDVRVEDRVFRVGVVPTGDDRAAISMRDDTELQRLTRSRRDLVANVSHDLRTPLSSLVLLVEMLLAEGDARRRADVASRLNEQVATLRALADALVELNRLESGRVLLRLEPVPLLDVASTAAEGLRPQAEQARVHIELSVPPEQVVLADRGQLVRVLTNLLDNALRFSPPGSRVRVTAGPAEEADRVEVRVRDEGPGISVTEAKRVFERFYRSDPARSGSGKGLGLAIARHVIEGHGGRIWVDPRTRGGTTICFTLPRAE